MACNTTCTTLSWMGLSNDPMIDCMAQDKIAKKTRNKNFLLLFPPPVPPAIIASFSDDAEVECLDFPLIQQDAGPVELVVNVTADPCPQVNWYINDTLINGNTSGIEVSYGCIKCVCSVWMIFMHYI